MTNSPLGMGTISNLTPLPGISSSYGFIVGSNCLMSCSIAFARISTTTLGAAAMLSPVAGFSPVSRRACSSFSPSGQTAPCTIQSRNRSTCSCGSGPPFFSGGIKSSWSAGSVTLKYSVLFSKSNGTTAGSLPPKACWRSSSRRSPLSCPSRWQLTQVASKIGLMSSTKSIRRTCFITKPSGHLAPAAIHSLSALAWSLVSNSPLAGMMSSSSGGRTVEV